MARRSPLESFLKLPNGEFAVVDMAKLVDYCFDPEHWRGRHKARVFSSALGITAGNSDILLDGLLAAARNEQALPGLVDEYGQRFVVEFPLKGPSDTAQIVSAWVIRTDEDFPRLTTCFVK